MISYLYLTWFFITIIHASLYHIPVSKCPKEAVLRKCLYQNHIKGPIYFRDNTSAYINDLNVEYNRRVIFYPTAFVHAIDVLDVQKTIKCAAKLKYPIVTRS
ncbi:18957_t:CDS:1, partial [Gigaspora rosea]